MAKSRYEYSPPSYDTMVDRAERKGSLFDNLFDDVQLYKSKQGANLLRILPQGWRSSHYGLTVMVHGGVGPNDRRYLCLKENPTSPYKRCPVCEELYHLGSRATQEEKNQLRPKPSVIYYVIDRDNEKDGVQVWMTSSTTDSELAAQSVNRRTQSVLDIVNPDDGYDIEFTRTGAGRNNTRYRGFQVMREPSPLAESERRTDEWLEIAFGKPLPSILKFYSPEHIEEILHGRAKEDGEEKSRTRARDQDTDDDRPLRRTRDPDDDVDERPRDRGRGADDERPARDTRRSGRDDDDDTARPSRAERDERTSSRDDTRDGERPSRARGREPDDTDDRSSRGRLARGDDDNDKPQERPARSSLARELDDEIPSEGGRRARSNGRADDNEVPEKQSQERERPRRQPDDTDAEERPARTRSRPAPDDADDEARHEARRERLRERVNRE